MQLQTLRSCCSQPSDHKHTGTPQVVEPREGAREAMLTFELLNWKNLMLFTLHSCAVEHQLCWWRQLEAFLDLGPLPTKIIVHLHFLPLSYVLQWLC